MSITRSSLIPPARASVGLTTVSPSSGLSRATRGLVQDYPGGVAPVGPALDPVPLLSTQAVDSQGVQRLLSDAIVSLQFVDVNQETFANPDREYSGFGADGFLYELGIKALPVTEASWRTEALTPSSNRGPSLEMPPRIIVVATSMEVALFDADSLDLWIRFLVGVVNPPLSGKLAGMPSTRIREVRYASGFLLIACSDGLRVASFKDDQGIQLTETGKLTATGGLVDRNSDTYLDGPFLPSAAESLLATDCLSLSCRHASMGALQGATTRDVRVVSLLGHPNGLTAITMGGQTGIVSTVAPHICKLSVPTGWSVEDDADLDMSTPYFVDDAFGATNWVALGVAVGDTLILDSGDSHRIVEIQQATPGRRLVVDPEISLGSSGASYLIHRPMGAVEVASNLDAYFANGTNSLSVFRGIAWATTPGSAFSNMNFTPGSQSILDVAVGRVNSLALNRSSILAATDIGVYEATDTELDGRAQATLTYSTQSLVSPVARYRVLGGDVTNCEDVVIDPETGNILVAVTDGSSVITEITPGPEHAFRSFASVGIVLALLAYRNPNESVAN